MRGITTELKVGIFVLIVIAILAYMTFKISGKEWFRKEGYIVYVSFESIEGLDEKTTVKVAGVDAGVIERIVLEKGKAKVKIRIYPGIMLYQDAIASIKTSGLLGDKYLDIKPGTEEPYLKDGETIQRVREPADIDEMVYMIVSVSDSFEKLTENINNVFGTEENIKALKDTVNNLSKISENLNRVITTNDQRMKETLSGIDKLTASINRLIEENATGLKDTVNNIRVVSGSIKTEAPKMIEDLRNASLELRDLIQENRPKIANLTDKAEETISSVQMITEKIEKGEGTLGKLVTDERLYESVDKAASGVERTISRIDRFRTFITFQGEYLTKPVEGKGYFYVTLKPRPDKYYILGAVGDPIGSVTTTETVTTVNGVTSVEKEEEIEDKIEFTAQIAKRFNNMALRIGLTENTFGFGTDQFFLNDRLKVSADIWDFGNDEEGAKSPHLKLGVDYYLFKNIFVSAGVDNLLNSKWRGLYFGSGLTFEDEDFKYLFGTIPSMPTR